MANRISGSPPILDSNFAVEDRLADRAPYELTLRLRQQIDAIRRERAELVTKRDAVERRHLRALAARKPVPELEALDREALAIERQIEALYQELARGNRVVEVLSVQARHELAPEYAALWRERLGHAATLLADLPVALSALREVADAADRVLGDQQRAAGRLQTDRFLRELHDVRRQAEQHLQWSARSNGGAPSVHLRLIAPMPVNGRIAQAGEVLELAIEAARKCLEAEQAVLHRPIDDEFYSLGVDDWRQSMGLPPLPPDPEEMKRQRRAEEQALDEREAEERRRQAGRELNELWHRAPGPNPWGSNA